MADNEDTQTMADTKTDTSHQAAPAAPAPAPAPKPDPKAAAAAKADADARKAASRGAQVVLDPEGDAAVAARGGAASSLEENQAAWSSAMAAEGFDPADPNAHTTDHNPEEQKAAAAAQGGA